MSQKKPTLSKKVIDPDRMSSTQKTIKFSKPKAVKPTFPVGKPTTKPPVTVIQNKPQKQDNKPDIQPQNDVPIIGIKRALLIGINYFGTQNELNGCIKDVQNINNLLTTSYQYKPENVKILTDDQEDNKPTKINIINNINAIVALTKPGDTLFIHYSGHGTQVVDVDGDEKNNPDAKGKDDALCPCDFGNYGGISGFISDDELRKMIVNKIPKGAKLRAFFDCCHSGSALDLPYIYKSGTEYTQIEPNVTQSDDCLLVSGCRDFQTSADAYINNQYSGALTWALVQALTTSVKIKTTWKDLLLIVRHSLATAKYDQVPMLSIGNKQIGNNFIDL